MSTNLIHMLESILQTTPDRVALIHGQEQITFRELDARSRAVGTFFQAAGVHPGARALLLTPLGIEFYVIFLGLVRIGVTVMLVDPAVGQAQIAECCRMAQPDLFIGSPKAHLLRLFNGAIRRIPRKFSLARYLPRSTFVDIHHANSNGKDAATTADIPALITFTSGSTGQPKGICRTHGFLLQQHAVLCRTISARTDSKTGATINDVEMSDVGMHDVGMHDVEMNTLPVFVLSSLARGSTVVIPQSFRGRPITVNAAQVVDELQRHRVNRLLAAPAFCDQIAEQLAATDQTLSTIERVYTGGGPVFPSLVDKLQQRLPNAAITAVYGSTEAEPIAHVNLSTLLPHEQQAMARGHGLLAGKPIAEIQLAILPDMVGRPIGPFTGESFAVEQLPPNCAGEIVVCGDHVQKSYLGGDDGLTKFRVGETIWHRTGDAGYLDGSGRLWLLGRCTARIGQRAPFRYPFSIEVAAMSYAGVERAAFVEVDGEQILAVQTAQRHWPELVQALRDALPTVTHIARLASIPVDVRHGSKVLYDELRKQLKEAS